MLSLEPFIQSNHQINLLRFCYELLRFITLESKCIHHLTGGICGL